MADKTVTRSATMTLSPATVQRFVSAGTETAPSYVAVTNLDGSAEVYVRTDGVNPTVGGDDSYAMPAAIAQLTVPSPAHSSVADVRVISAGSPKISVEWATTDED